MSHAYARNYVHLIFGTRESRKLIKPPIEIELRKALRGIAVQYGIDLIEIGATEDHVHLLVCMPPKIGVAVAVRVFKAESAKQVNESGHFYRVATGIRRVQRQRIQSRFSCEICARADGISSQPHIRRRVP